MGRTKKVCARLERRTLTKAFGWRRVWPWPVSSDSAAFVRNSTITTTTYRPPPPPPTTTTASSSSAILYDKDSGRSRGFGFVRFSNQADAQCAKDAMDGKALLGRPLRISYALEKVRGMPFVFRKMNFGQFEDSPSFRFQ